jgi:glycosyltransferase involved in cell wall biosynthesis
MYGLVVVSMFKNESMILKEWLDHNISIGVQHFYLIDNGSTDGYLRVLRSYMRNGYISLIRDPSRWKYGEESRAQIAPYFEYQQENLLVDKGRCDSTHAILINRHFLQVVKNDAKWVMVIDPDEYIFSPRAKISDVLLSIPLACTDIWIPWRVFGSGGHVTQPESVRKGFLYMKDFGEYKTEITNRARGKSISRASVVESLRVHTCDIHSRNTMTADGRLHGNFLARNLSSWIQTYEPRRDSNIFFCNHYITMSREYFTKCKSTRGGGAHEKRHWTEYWDKWNGGVSQIDALILTSTGIVDDRKGVRTLIREARAHRRSEKSL